MNDGAPTLIVQSLGLGHFNCSRLWSREGSIHDGFMDLVSCLDQLGLLVQETQSPLMSSLPVDHPFRYDGLVRSHGRVSYSTLPLWRRLSLGSLTFSRFAGASFRALFVSAHSMRHMLALLCLTHASSSGVRLQPQCTLSRSSTHHFLRETPTFGSFLQLCRTRHDAPLLPIVQEIL